MQKAGVKANFFLFPSTAIPYGGILIARRIPSPSVKRRWRSLSAAGWPSKDPAPGNALIKQDNPKMTDDLLARGDPDP